MTQKNVFIMDHALVHHKLAVLRDEKTTTKEFRELIAELAMLLGFKALDDVPLEVKQVKTPLETCEQRVIKDDSIAVVPILRAGLGMVDGILKLLPTAKVGHIGLYRDHDTLEPKEYYCKLPSDMDKKVGIIVDPMLATGGSAVVAINMLKAAGCKHIKLVLIVAAPGGIDAVVAAHPDVQIYVAAVDRCLNEKGYILPGLGDAGDRIFGTK
jgi:uracil phosphoribosyltransferase